MEELQDRYDELDTIDIELHSLIRRITDKEYIEIFEEIIYEVQKKKEEIEPRLIEMRDREEKYENYEYERSVI